MSIETNNTWNFQIVAIAQDEGPYLCEWIFHHLHFGFTNITILLNGTSDQSIEILDKIVRIYPNVSYQEIDGIVPYNQTRICEWAHSNYCNHPNTYLFFIDIDEFWTPFDFQSSIVDHVYQLQYPDIISFEWANKLNELPFSNPFESSNKYSKSFSVKSMFKADLQLKEVGHHNVLAPDATNLLADGTHHPSPYQPRVDLSNLQGPLKKSFLMHRLWRSQFEYIAHAFKEPMLKGFSIEVRKGLYMKKNRFGYELPKDNQVDFLITPENITTYNGAFKTFIRICNQDHLILQSRKLIQTNFHKGHSFLKSHNFSDERVERFCRNLDLDLAIFQSRQFFGLIRLCQQTMLDQKNKILMDWSFKCGSTAVIKMFFKHLGISQQFLNEMTAGTLHHYRINTYNKNKFCSTLDISGYYKFKIVRCPYRRLVSIFLHFMNHINIKSTFKEEAKSIKNVLRRDDTNLSFEEFVQYLSIIDIKSGDPHYHPQWKEAEAYVPMHRICRLELLAEEVTFLNELLGTNFELSKEKELHYVVQTNSIGYYGRTPYLALPKMPPNYASFYNEQLTNQTTILYQKDLSAYQYDFDQFSSNNYKPYAQKL